MKLPDPQDLCKHLAEAMRPQVTRDAVLVGIHTGGVWVAECLHGLLGLATPVGSVDTGYHRDDHRLGGSLKAGGRPSHLPFDVEGAHVVIVDDVLYTGRTIRAAMNELF
ncbi:MAG TPA: phosphoribosyltransferase family protein, partial [Rhodocyclaceae bacterium]|nr:phosphoribosyltransferase family protein [Rhodocyclaceae bacterium]